MSTAEILSAAKALPLADRVELARELWYNITDEGFDRDLTSQEIVELDRRAEEALKHPERLIPAEEVFARIEQPLAIGK